MAKKKGSIATAYVQVIPSMSGVEEKLGEGFGKSGKDAGNAFGSSLASTVKKAVIAAGLGTAVKEALLSGADMQQALGGIETLFKGSADIVKANAEQAFKTAGLSANEYMETVTSFSASLLQGLGGNTQEAARVADMALRDMSDNANKFGTDMESIQYAYQGFAKQNYTMLDNLKLGYGGTKAEMERLLADAQKLTGMKYDISNLNDVYEAIHVVQEEMGVTGTTAKEAATTFSGSLASMKAAASNVLANLTLGEDITPSLDALNETVFTFIEGNLLPMAGNLLSGLPEVVQQSMGMAIQGLNLAGNNADAIVREGKDLVIGIGSAIVSAAPYVAESSLSLVAAIGGEILATDWMQVARDTINSMQSDLSIASAEIFGSDKSIIEAVASGIRSNLPEIKDAAGDAIESMVDYVMSDGLPMVWDVGTDVALSLVDGVIECAPEAAGAALTLCGRFLGAVASNSPKFIESGIATTGKLVAGLIRATPDALSAAWKIAGQIKDKFLGFNWGQLGKDIIKGMANGIINAAWSVIKAVKDVAANALRGAKTELDIHSPSRKFQNEVGAQIPPGIAIGVKKNADVVKASMAELADYAQSSFNTDFTVEQKIGLIARGGVPAPAQADPVLALLQDVLDSNLQAYERIIYLLELLLEAILNIDVGGDTITKLITDYQRKVAVVKGG